MTEVPKNFDEHSSFTSFPRLSFDEVKTTLDKITEEGGGGLYGDGPREHGAGDGYGEVSGGRYGRICGSGYESELYGRVSGRGGGTRGCTGEGGALMGVTGVSKGANEGQSPMARTCLIQSPAYSLSLLTPYQEEGQILANPTGENEGEEDEDEGITRSVSARRKERLVHQLAKRNSLGEDIGFKVSFADEGKVKSWQDRDGAQHLFTTTGCWISVQIEHAAPSSASVRFLVVFSDHSHSATPIRLCLKHKGQQIEHDHILTVRRSSEPILATEPHLSCRVTPWELDREAYRAYLSFHCFGACFERRKMTLITQLEFDGRVVGRRSFSLSITANPGRAFKAEKMKTRNEAGSNRSRKGFRTSKQEPQSLGAEQDAAEAAFRSALQKTQNLSLLLMVSDRFKSLHPEEYAAVVEDFLSLKN
ncbi:uncharacterized protein LOC119583578 [Penaeus monodon]|uniref:uncharacterized protein LOC119583578 n=1 Tax=Penaeus monodon TaxID=6687 RepID=UPI0018A78317|nr:uncharacterized protein LOC119583578 [Penaeus monodon]